MANKLMVTAGDVIEVQLTSETVVIEGADRRHVEPGHITNRMRLFVKLTDGKEQKYDFEDTELGVRETQRVVIVRGQGNGKLDRGPYNIALYNLSSNERGEFEPGLRAYLAHRSFFGPFWKAGAFALGLMLLSWLVSNLFMRNAEGEGISWSLAALFGIFAYPVFWWLIKMWDRVTERVRYRAARKRFLLEMDARSSAYAPQANASAAPVEAQTPPEANPA